MPDIHKEGYPFIAVAVIASLILFAISDTLGWMGIIISAWVVYFFRDPERIIPQGEGLVVSGGDGVVSRITEATPPAELEMPDVPMTRISVFLNIFNVHVNRVPVTGKVERIYYHAGKFLNASLDKASTDNERQSIWIKTADGKDIAVSQIAGLVARRIVCDLENSQSVEAGDRFGIIRFGSRVDVYIPKDISPLVVEGQTVIGGETILADLNVPGEARKGKKV